MVHIVYGCLLSLDELANILADHLFKTKGNCPYDSGCLGERDNETEKKDWDFYMSLPHCPCGTISEDNEQGFCKFYRKADK